MLCCCSIQASLGWPRRVTPALQLKECLLLSCSRLQLPTHMWVWVGCATGIRPRTLLPSKFFVRMRRQLLLLALAGLLAVSLATDKPAEEPAAAKAEEKAAEKAVEEKKEPEYAYKELEDWVIANGGAVSAEGPD